MSVLSAAQIILPETTHDDEGYESETQSDEGYRLTTGLIHNPPDDSNSWYTPDDFLYATTFAEFLAANVRYLKGELPCSSYMPGPVYDMNVQNLIDLHEKHGILTCCGQSGSRQQLPDGSMAEQRSYLSLMCDCATLDKVCNVMIGLSSQYYYRWCRVRDCFNQCLGPTGTGNMPADRNPVTRKRADANSPFVNQTHMQHFMSDSEYFMESELREVIGRANYCLVDIRSIEWASGDAEGDLLRGLNQYVPPASVDL